MKKEELGRRWAKLVDQAERLCEGKSDFSAKSSDDFYALLGATALAIASANLQSLSDFLRFYDKIAEKEGEQEAMEDFAFALMVVHNILDMLSGNETMEFESEAVPNGKSA